MSRALLLTAAAVAASGYYLLARGAGDEDESDEPTIAPQTIVEIFEELFVRMRESVERMVKSIQEHKNSGNHIPEQYLAQVILQNFESTLVEAQEEVFAQHGVEEDDLREAVDFFTEAEHREVVAAVEKFQQLYTQIGGSVEADLPDDLDVDVMCGLLEEYVARRAGGVRGRPPLARALADGAEARDAAPPPRPPHALARYMDAMLSAQEDAVKLALAAGRPISGEELQARIQKPVQEKTAKVLGRYGLSQMQLQTAIKQFQEDPKFTAKIKSIEETQAPRIQKVQQLTGGGRSMGLM